MKVLITGASGRVGAPACRAFAQAGHDVLATDIRPHDGLQVSFEPADLREPGHAQRLLDGRDVLVHLGNVPSDHRAKDRAQVYIDNATINIRAFEAARLTGTRCVIFASSIQAISGPRPDAQDGVPNMPSYLPVDGHYPVRARSAYGLSKAAGEQTLAHLAQNDPTLSAYAIRFPTLAHEDPWLYRRRQPTRPATEEQRRARARLYHMHHVDEFFSYLLMADATSLMLAAAEQRPPGFHTLFPASRRPNNARPVRQLIREHYPNVPLRKPLEQIEALVDTQAITDLLGWEPSSADSDPVPA